MTVSNRVAGGRAYYGEAVGIALFDGRRYPMVPGDVGNASTYDFPVRLKVVKGLYDCPKPPGADPSGAPPPEVALLIDAARELEADGVRAVVTCCGFFSLVQDALADAVKVPVFTSPLLLIPVIARMIGRRRTIGVLTASEPLLTRPYLAAAGVDRSVPLAVAGLERSSEFMATHMGGTRTSLDVDLLRQEVVTIARDLAARNPDLGALVLECSTLPSFAADIQDAVGLPVFDYVGFINLIYRSVVQQPYEGFV
jgi:Asp/Glu/hydantoin racemase